MVSGDRSTSGSFPPNPENENAEGVTFGNM
jgi:hypothetical protein